MCLSSVQNTLTKLYRKGRVYFVPDYGKFGLIPIALIVEPTVIEELPYGTVSVRNIYGGGRILKLISALIPYVFLEEYCNSIPANILILIRGLKYYRWRPDDGGTLYLPEKGTLIPVFSNIFTKEEYPENNCFREVENITPDIYDLIILSAKLHRGPFIRHKEALKEALKIDQSIALTSSQTLSYHFKRHVMPAWLYNTFIPYLPMNEVPFRLFYIKGKEAHIVARSLIKLPYFSTALIDVNTALVLGQPPCFMHERIFELLTMFDIEFPYGEIIMSSKSIVKSTPYLWKFVRWDGGRWVWWWPEERLRVRVRK